MEHYITFKRWHLEPAWIKTRGAILKSIRKIIGSEPVSQFWPQILLLDYVTTKNQQYSL